MVPGNGEDAPAGSRGMYLLLRVVMLELLRNLQPYPCSVVDLEES
jgi:hypothetical protein